jgi:hypothetical protein
MNALPLELVEKIIEFLPTLDHLRLASTCTAYAGTRPKALAATIIRQCHCPHFADFARREHNRSLRFVGEMPYPLLIKVLPMCSQYFDDIFVDVLGEATIKELLADENAVKVLRTIPNLWCCVHAPGTANAFSTEIMAALLIQNCKLEMILIDKDEGILEATFNMHNG